MSLLRVGGRRSEGFFMRRGVGVRCEMCMLMYRDNESFKRAS